jgi:CheY-like chemotaxis protein
MAEFISNVYEEDGQQVIQCNIRDIGERKRAQAECTRLLERAITAHAEADAANGIRDEFLATLSHELRTPLTSILGWSNLLTTGNLDEATTKSALETIERNARAQRQLIDDLLDISRIITVKLRLDVRPVELASVIEAVVDDEPDTRELIAAVLAGRGAEVVSVGSAVEALEEMERQRFDVLVSDIGMPSMDGYALIEKVPQLPSERGGKIPAAALTAYAGVEHGRRARAAGYQMHIPKPVEPSELTTVVAGLAARVAVPQ